MGRSDSALGFGTLASRCAPLVLLPWHPRAGSRSSAQQPVSGSRPLYAGRRPPGHQAPGGLIPEMWTASGFDGTYGYRRVFEGLLPLGFRTPTCPRSIPGLLIRRSPPRLLTAAARTGSRPAPESRSRWAYHHLLRSFTPRFSVQFIAELLSVPLRHDTRQARQRPAHRMPSASDFAPGVPPAKPSPGPNSTSPRSREAGTTEESSAPASQQGGVRSRSSRNPQRRAPQEVRPAVGGGAI